MACALYETQHRRCFFLVDELLENEVLVSVGQGGIQNGGRKPIMLEVNRNWRQIVTFRLDLDGIEYVLYDMVCQPLEKIKRRIKGNDYVTEMDAILKQSEALSRRMLSPCALLFRRLRIAAVSACY